MALGQHPMEGPKAWQGWAKSRGAGTGKEQDDEDWSEGRRTWKEGGEEEEKWSERCSIQNENPPTSDGGGWTGTRLWIPSASLNGTDV